MDDLQDLMIRKKKRKQPIHFKQPQQSVLLVKYEEGFSSSAKTKSSAEIGEVRVDEDLTMNPNQVAEAFSKKFTLNHCQSERGSHHPTPGVPDLHWRHFTDSLNLHVVHPALYVSS